MGSKGNYSILQDYKSGGLPSGGSSFLVEDMVEMPGKQFVMQVRDYSKRTHEERRQAFEKLTMLQELGSRSRYFKEIIEIHQNEDEIWWIEAKVETVQLRDKIEVHWSEEELHHLVFQIADALDQLYEACGIAHGNLNSQNVLVYHSYRDNSYSNPEIWPILTGVDLLPGRELEQNLKTDLLDVARIIIGVVTNECCDQAEIQFPLHPHPGWESLGKKNDYWKNLATWLACPGLSIERLNVRKIKLDLSEIKKPALPRLAALIAFVLLLSFGIAAMAHQQFWGGRELELTSASDTQISAMVNQNFEGYGSFQTSRNQTPAPQKQTITNMAQTPIKSIILTNELSPVPDSGTNSKPVAVEVSEDSKISAPPIRTDPGPPEISMVTTNDNLELPDENEIIEVEVKEKFPAVDGVEWESSSGLKFVYIQDLPSIRTDIGRRTFLPGQPGGKEIEGSQSIRKKGGYLSLTEVSQSMFQYVMGDNPSIGQGPDLPVNSVSWVEAIEFCRRLTSMELASDSLPEDWIITLPSRLQLNYLAGLTVSDQTGGELLKSNRGKIDLSDVLSLSQRRIAPLSVFKGKAYNRYNVLGLYGNVREWCFDEDRERVITSGWSYDFSGNTEKAPFFSVPKTNRSFKLVGLRCVIIRATD